MRKVGQNIKRFREAKGMTQESVAGQMMATRTLQRLEDGDGNPTLATLAEISKALGIRITDLIETEAEAQSHRHENMTWELLSKIGHWYDDAEPRRQLAALYILTKDRAFLAELSNLPAGARFAQVLEKLLRA